MNSSSGLVFHAGEKGQRTMMLSVSDGHLKLQINGGRRKTSIRSIKKYNDGLWHTVRMWMCMIFYTNVRLFFFYIFFFPQISIFYIELIQVFVKVEGGKAFLTADGIDTQSKKVTGGGKSQFGAPLYIGGLPSDHSAAEVNTVLQTL